MSLKMKYFVLKPHGDSPHAIASRSAMLTYAESISDCDRELAQSLLSWIDREQSQPQQGEGGNSSPTGQPTQVKTPAAPTPKREIAAEIEKLLFGSPEVYKYVSVDRRDLKRWRRLLLT